ncbi:DUF5928 domain-containing protein [Palleronia sp. KMU-117]|uniref:DUF5928 domain-containing protein n=1 Tax=Palleronia sp. KMU-117 TaxID=3434108 RepID=UPI003D712117
MARIAFLLLCHRDPAGVLQLVADLTAPGDLVAIHYDARAPKAEFQILADALKNNPSVTFARRRIRCGWGEWSLVEATLQALSAARDAFPEATHFYLISGDCRPIKSAEHVHAALDRDDADRIESVDFHTSGWIKTGFQEERLIYRHIFNERRHKRLYYASIAAQKALGLRRRPPPGLQIRIGSQWWCLRRATVDAILDFCQRRPEVIRFFRRTWIPDEIFFQTLVHHLVPRDEIRLRPPTFLMFSDYGMPVTFYNDHGDLLLGQEEFFARKISPGATALKERLGRLYSETGHVFPPATDARRLYDFVTRQGRIGRRHGRRFWESDTSVGAGRELLIVVCKKWHVARRFADDVSFVSNVAMLDYIFDEEDVALPDLGGIGMTIGKRTRHRRAFLRLLFEHFATDRLLICLDPANIDLLRDVHADRNATRTLAIECDLSDHYLIGHALRIGLVSQDTPPATVRQLLPTLRNTVHAEVDAIRDCGLAGVFRIRERASPEENARAIEGFLGIPAESALRIASHPTLFAD